jgi:hypothetical protein
MTPQLVEQHFARHGLSSPSVLPLSPAAGPAKAASELHAQEHG